MVNKFSKKEVEKKINHFFESISKKTPKEIKKIKKLAMHYKIRLGNYKRLFCKKCYFPHVNSSIRIKNEFINIECRECNYKSRFRIS